MKFIVLVQMISFCNLKNYNFFNIISQVIFFLIILYLWFKVISIEATVYVLDQKLKKENNNINTNTSCLSGTCSIPLNNNYETFNTFKMDDMIMKEVFSYCDQPEESNNNIKLPVAEHVKIVIEDEDNNIINKDEIKINDVFDLKKDENDNISVNSNINKKKINKINKLNLDALRQKCIELNLESEGSKNDLIERILNNDS